MANTNGTAVAYGEITILDLLDDATYIYYSDDSSGSGASLSPTGKSYIGIYNGPALSTGQPAPDTQEYTDIKRDIKWSQYVGEDGKDGNGIVSTEIRYQNGSSSTDKPEGAWSEKIPAAESGKYLWTRTTLTYADGTTSVSYSVGAHGEDGQDGDKYIFVPNYEKIAKSETLEGTNWTPSEVTFSVYEVINNQVNQALNFPIDFANETANETKKLGYKIQIKTNNGFLTIPNNLIYLLNSDGELIERYFIHGGISMDTEKYLEESAIIHFELEQFYKTLSDMFKTSSSDVSLLAIDTDVQTCQLSDSGLEEFSRSFWEALVDIEGSIRIVLIKNGKEVAYKPISFGYGVTKAIALFNVNADGINAAVGKNKLSFDENGLTVQNGGFRIYQDEIKPKIFSATPSGFKNGINYYILEKADNGESIYTLALGNFSPTTEYYIKQKDEDNNETYIRASTTDFISNSSFVKDVTYYELIDGLYIETEDKAPILGKVYYTNVPNLVLSVTAEKGLYLNGNGVFEGTINANSGYFKGEIIASSGTIGGFTIGEKALTSLNNNIVLDGQNGELKLARAHFDSLALNGGATLYGRNNIAQNDIFVVKNEENATTYLTITKDGLLKVGDGIVIDGVNGEIKTANYSSTDATGWSISSDLAEFNNVNVRGKITNSVFESGKVSSVGGILLIRPSTIIKEISADGTILTLENPSGFDIGHSVYFGDSKYGCISSIEKDQITLAKAVSVKEGDVITSFGKKKSIGLGINGAEINVSAGTAIIPQQSFSVFEWTQSNSTTGEGTATAKIILGKLPSGQEYAPFQNTFGLYAENVLLKGSLVTNSSDFYSGISTLVAGENAPKSSAEHFKNNNSEILLWAGAEGTTSDAISKSPFYVDRKGNLYAGSGYFAGAVITKARITAGILQAATIMGGSSDGYADGHALKIVDDVGIAIYGNISSDEDDVLDGKIPDVEIGASWIKMSKEGSNISIRDNVSITETAISTPKVYLNSKTSKLYMYANEKISDKVEATGLSFSMADTENYEFTDDFGIEEWSSDKAENRTLSVLNGKKQLLTFSKQDVISSVPFSFKDSITYGEKMEYRKVTNSSNETIGYDLYI